VVDGKPQLSREAFDNELSALDDVLDEFPIRELDKVHHSMLDFQQQQPQVELWLDAFQQHRKCHQQLPILDCMPFVVVVVVASCDVVAKESTTALIALNAMCHSFLAGLFAF
jgi:hypothetical protein